MIDDRLAEIEHGGEAREPLLEVLEDENMPDELDSARWLIAKVKQLIAENERLQKQVAGMRATLEDFANPDHWQQNDDGEWIWHGYYPPFERPAVDLLGTLGPTHD